MTDNSKKGMLDRSLSGSDPKFDSEESSFRSSEESTAPGTKSQNLKNQLSKFKRAKNYYEQLYLLQAEYDDKTLYPKTEDHILYNELGIEKQDLKVTKISTKYDY